MSNKKLYWMLYWLFGILMVVGFIVTVMLYLHYKEVCIPMGVSTVITAVFGWLGDIQQNRLQKLGEL